MTTKKIIGLNLELATIESALNAVKPLMEGSIEDDHLGPREAGAVLALVVARLGLIRAAIRGEIDPAVAWAEHSATVDSVKLTDDPDMKLVAWSTEEALARLKVQTEQLRKVKE